MGRKKADLGPGSDDRIVAMMARGQSREDIARELGCSPATAGRRMAAVKGGVPAVRNVARPALPPPRPPAPAAEGELPDPESVDESTPLEQVDEWLDRATRLAESATDPDDVAKMTRLATTLLAMKVKHTRVPPPDPNDNPDFIAAAAVARRKLHVRLDAIQREHGIVCYVIAEEQ